MNESEQAKKIKRKLYGKTTPNLNKFSLMDALLVGWLMFAVSCRFSHENSACFFLLRVFSVYMRHTEYVITRTQLKTILVYCAL